MLTLRLMDEAELTGDAHPEQCVELAVPRLTTNTITIRTLRLAPADLVRLRTEADLVLSDIRTEVMRAEAAWRQLLGEWHADGRRATLESRETDVRLLARVLEALRRDDLVLV